MPVTVNRRRALVEATHTRVLDAAARLSRDRNPSGFSMDDVAREAGVARATVYEHFHTEQRLLDELATTAARATALRGLAEAASEPDPITALAAVLRAAGRHWSTHEEAVRDARRLLGGDAGPMLAQPRVAGDGDGLRALVQRLADAGRLAPGWNVEDAYGALQLLTSFDAYDTLRRAAPLGADEVPRVIGRLGAALVTVP